MQQTRKTLSIRVPAESGTATGPGEPAELIRHAINRKTCLRAVYNRMAIEVAPHILYTKHDDLFVDGVVLLREGKPPKEVKMGVFKLAGLSDLTLTLRKFEPHSMFDARDSKYADAMIQVVQR